MSQRIKIATLGSRFHASQIDRIDAGFAALGHEIVPLEAADLVYVNDAGHYAEAIAAKREGRLRPDAFLVFCILDLAPHLGDAFPLARVIEQLSHAHAIVCISQTVAADIRARLGITAPVIYNPIKPVTRTRFKRYPFRAMFVGRVNDAEKRAHLGAQALNLLGFTSNEVVTVGNEPPYYGGTFFGVADDSTLAELYNSVDFLMCPTRNAFLGLPALEAAAAGCVPVICCDMDIREEFFPSDVFPEYANVTPDAAGIATFMASLLTDDGLAMEWFKERLSNHFEENWRQRLSGVGVAKAIVDLYQERNWV